MAKSQYDELRRIIRGCCDEAERAGKLATSSAKRVDGLHATIENFRGRLSTLEEMVRSFARAASKVSGKGNTEK